MGVDGGTQPVALTHEAARAVKTLATHHCVEALGRIALGHALGNVLVISVPRVEPHAKHLDPARATALSEHGGAALRPFASIPNDVQWDLIWLGYRSLRQLLISVAAEEELGRWSLVWLRA